MMFTQTLSKSRCTFLSALLIALCVGIQPATAQTPFEQDVSAAIDDGLQFLRDESAFTGTFGDRHRSRGMVLLALLEKRDPADPYGPVLGYANSDPADQALARTAVELIMEDTIYGVPRSFYAYSHGENMMALSLYATTGGPDITPDGVYDYTLEEAIDKLVDETLARQDTNPVSLNYGFWGYTSAGNDSSTTQFAVAGLAGAKGYYTTMGDPGGRIPLINQALDRSVTGYANRQRFDGGFGYRTSGYTSSYAQTGSGMYVSLLGGALLNDPAIQGFLNWQYQNYNYQTIDAAYNWWKQSYYYYLWATAKGYTVIEDSGVAPAPGNLSPADLGTLPAGPIILDRPGFRLAQRDPLTDPDARAGGSPGKYFEETPRWYYDYAYTLMTHQNPVSGQFPAPGHGCWQTYVCQAYAILVLERAVGIACLDPDDDGICTDQEPFDNCPVDPNPGQEDGDGDGVGDDCDLCPGADDTIDDNSNGIPDCLENQPPVADANGPYAGDEGDGVTLGATGSYDPDGDPLTFLWTVAGGDCDDLTLATPTCTWPDNGTFSVCVTVDDGQVSDDDCTTATIANVAPEVGPITAPIDPWPISDPVCASASFTDAGTDDTHTAEWDWGDTTTSAGTVDETDGSGTVGAGDTDCHTYGEAGVYTLELTVTDKDDGVGSSIFQYVVVYDPDAGFVTGGGWIDSPAGAFVADPTLTGRANFGFVSKYKKGRTAPEGSTEFQFHAGDINFHSNTYEWLVIAGPKAMYKGVGTINGDGNFGFLLKAIDEKLTPSTDVDLFSIKIFDKDNGDAVVYDNGLGADINDDPATAISGGQIVIHKKK